MLDGIDESLRTDLQQIRLQLENDPGAVIKYARLSSSLEVEAVGLSDRVTSVYRDTERYSTREQEMMPYRELETVLQVGGQNYRVILRKLTVEYDDLFLAIAGAELLLILLLGLGMWWLNRGLLKRLWHPFFGSLEAAGKYQAGSGALEKLPASDIDEFERLNNVLREMTRTIERDYRSLKQFTENASHEIQTPLSVIKNRVELLIQREDADEEQMELIREVYESANKLSRLNRGLLLLAKIENRQFEESETLYLGRLASEQLEFLEEMIDTREISVSTDIKNEEPVQMNRDLAELLVRNLVSNAVRHGNVGGDIRIQATAQSLILSNTGQPPEPGETPARSFERFKKARQSGSLGLGLSIVKAICEVYGFEADYRYEDGYHFVEIDFGK